MSVSMCSLEHATLVKAHADLLKKFSSGAEDTFLLFGLAQNSDLHLTSVTLRVPELSLSSQISQDENYFPGGINFLGLCRRRSWEEQDISEIFISTLLPDILLVHSDDQGELTASIAQSGAALHPIKLHREDLLPPAVTFYLQGALTTTGDNGTADVPVASVSRWSYFIESVRALVSKSGVSVFDELKPTNEKQALSKFLSEVLPSKKDVMEQIYIKTEAVASIAPETAKLITPVLCSYRVGDKPRRFDIDVIGAACMTLTSPVNMLYPTFVQAINRQCNLIKQYYSTQDKASIPQTSYFEVAGFYSLVCQLYPSTVPDDDLESCRRSLHVKFLQPQTGPVFQRANAVDFQQPSLKGHLLNVHIGLSCPDKKAVVNLVRGRYAYYHYMQDGMNDDQWGCAYRSLQTISSWLRLQGYTTADVPSHRLIQETLVAIGDKEKKFIGSRQWIGSLEVSYCLEKLFNVTSKIMFVSSGAELAEKGRELLHHFETQGSPIMIGGGVLAHTILGVCFNELTGDLQYLVLDPHYTGADDRNIINSKGWCAWKKSSFWKKDSYYNLCMPQVAANI